MQFDRLYMTTAQSSTVLYYCLIFLVACKTWQLETTNWEAVNQNKRVSIMDDVSELSGGNLESI